jgi:TonB family protein
VNSVFDGRSAVLGGSGKHAGIVTAVLAVLVAGSLHAEECPKPNQRDFDSYAVVTAETAGESWVPPKLKKQTKPEYPRAAFKAKLEGTVVVRLIIDENGCVAATRIVQSVPVFDKAALDCVMKWRFVPARSGANSVATIATAPVRFRWY